MFSGAGACFAFPGVDWVASRSQALFPNDGDLWGANLLEHSLAAGDPVRLVRLQILSAHQLAEFGRRM